MKRMTILLLLCVFVIPAAADDVPMPEPTQNPDATYRLFRTQNIYTLLKLDTRTGQVWQVQWGADDDHRFVVAINSAPHDSDTGPLHVASVTPALGRQVGVLIMKHQQNWPSLRNSLRKAGLAVYAGRCFVASGIYLQGQTRVTLPTLMGPTRLELYGKI